MLKKNECINKYLNKKDPTKTACSVGLYRVYCVLQLL